jgi:hypothetical protein
MIFKLKKYFVIYILYPIRSRINLKNLIKYYGTNNSNQDINEAINLLNKKNCLMIPFNYVSKYENLHFEINFDSEYYPFIVVNNNEVYFPKGTSAKDLLGSVKTHFIEQDIESPHRYVAPYTIMNGHTAVLVGASDGLLALDLMDIFEHIFLIEADENWIIPLKKTFKKHLEKKITIIQAFATDINDGSSKRLDDIFKDYIYPIDFLQADVEGAACVLLKGAKNLLTTFSPKLAIACYHTHEESDEISVILGSLNYKISFSQKFVYMWMQRLKVPFLRNAVLYAVK